MGTPTTDIASTSDFDLDIRLIESEAGAAELINLTDDNCGTTCPSTCVTSTAG